MISIKKGYKSIIKKNETRAETLERIKNEIKSLISHFLIYDDKAYRHKLFDIVRAFKCGKHDATIFDILEAEYITEDNGSILLDIEED